MLAGLLLGVIVLLLLLLGGAERRGSGFLEFERFPTDVHEDDVAAFYSVLLERRPLLVLDVLAVEGEADGVVERRQIEPNTDVVYARRSGRDRTWLLLKRLQLYHGM